MSARHWSGTVLFGYSWANLLSAELRLHHIRLLVGSPLAI